MWRGTAAVWLYFEAVLRNAARDAGVVVAPAMAFYGDWATSCPRPLMGAWYAAAEIRCIAVALTLEADAWNSADGPANPCPKKKKTISSFPIVD